MNFKLYLIYLSLFFCVFFWLGCQSEQEESWEKGIEPYYETLPLDIEKSIIAIDTIYEKDSTINGYFLIYNISNNEGPLSDVGKTGRIGRFEFGLDPFWIEMYQFDTIVMKYSKRKGLAFNEYDLISEPSHDANNCTTIAFIKNCPCDTSYTSGTYQTYVIEPFNKRKVGKPHNRVDAFYHIGYQIWLYDIKRKDIFYHKTVAPLDTSNYFYYPNHQLADFLFDCFKDNHLTQ